MVKLDLNSKKQKRKKRIFGGTIIVLLAVFAFWGRKMYIRVEVENFQFTESARYLQNPNRGFYHMYTFWITEDETDYEELIDRMYYEDKIGRASCRERVYRRV